MSGRQQSPLLPDDSLIDFDVFEALSAYQASNNDGSGNVVPAVAPADAAPFENDFDRYFQLIDALASLPDPVGQDDMFTDEAQEADFLQDVGGGSGLVGQAEAATTDVGGPNTQPNNLTLDQTQHGRVEDSDRQAEAATGDVDLPNTQSDNHALVQTQHVRVEAGDRQAEAATVDVDLPNTQSDNHALVQIQHARAEAGDRQAAAQGVRIDYTRLREEVNRFQFHGADFLTWAKVEMRMLPLLVEWHTDPTSQQEGRRMQLIKQEGKYNFFFYTGGDPAFEQKLLRPYKPEEADRYCVSKPHRGILVDRRRVALAYQHRPKVTNQQESRTNPNTVRGRVASGSIAESQTAGNYRPAAVIPQQNPGANDNNRNDLGTAEAFCPDLGSLPPLSSQVEGRKRQLERLRGELADPSEQTKRRWR